MLSANKAVNAIFRYFKGKISKSWIKGNLAKYLAIYEVRENGMVIPLPESPKDSCIGKAIDFAKDVIDEIKEAVIVTASDLKDEIEKEISTDEAESEKEITASPTSSVKDKDEHTKYSDEEIKENFCGMRISFNNTPKDIFDLILSGKKTQDYRLWSENYAKKIGGCIGQIITATRKGVDYNIFVKNIYQQKLGEMTYTDVCAQGFEDFSPQDFINQFFGGDNSLEVWVIDFEVVKYLDKPWEKVQKLTQKWLSPEEEKLKAQQNRMIQQKRLADEKVTLERANYLKSLDNSLGVTQ